MKGVWQCKRCQPEEKLPCAPSCHLNANVNMKAAETTLLLIIAILLLSLVWVTNFSHRCLPNHSDLMPIDNRVMSHNEETLTNHLKNVQNNEEDTVANEEATEDGIRDMRSGVYQSALNPLWLFRQSVDGPPPSCMPNGQCQITCSNYPARNFQDMIDFINKQFKECDQGTLTITGTNFRDGAIQSGWLKDLNMQVTQLALLNNLKCNAAHLGQGAFSGEPFDSLVYLTLEEDDLKYLERKVFEGSRLTTVEIRHNEQRATKFEAGVFEPISSSLVMLQLQYCINDAATLRNITGVNGVTLSALKQLDLRMNIIPEITADVFTKVGMVGTIYLDSCAIESIDVHAFDRLMNLQQITLSNNLLTTLPERIFSGTTVLAKINLEKNPWICDCHLAWLQKMYIDTRRRFLKALYCGSVEFSKAEFICGSTTIGTSSTQPDYTSTSKETTETSHTSLITSTRRPTHSTTITTRTPPTPTAVTTSSDRHLTTTTSSTTTNFPVTKKPSFLPVKCVPLRSVDYFDPDDAMELQLEKSNFSMSFVLEDDGNSVSCNVKLVGNNNTNSMKFLGRDLTNGVFRCYRSISYNNTYKLDGLNYNRSYLLCLLTGTEGESANINPYNCIAITTPLPYDERPWLTNGLKTKAIIGLVGAASVLILLLVFLMYYCCRRHSRHVIDSQPQFVVPRSGPYHEYSAPSYRSISDGYLTPRIVRSEKYYEMPLSPSRYRRKSFQVSYQSPGYLGRYSFMRRRNSAHNSEHLYEVPPPLPPNHPVGDRYIRHSETSEFM